MEQQETKNEKRFYTVKEFHGLLGGVITRSMVYKMIDAGDIPVRYIGNKIIIPAGWVDTYINTPCTVVKKVRSKERKTDGKTS